MSTQIPPTTKAGKSLVAQFGVGQFGRVEALALAIEAEAAEKALEDAAERVRALLGHNIEMTRAFGTDPVDPRDSAYREFTVPPATVTITDATIDDGLVDRAAVLAILSGGRA